MNTVTIPDWLFEKLVFAAQNTDDDGWEENYEAGYRDGVIKFAQTLIECEMWDGYTVDEEAADLRQLNNYWPDRVESLYPRTRYAKGFEDGLEDVIYRWIYEN